MLAGLIAVAVGLVAASPAAAASSTANDVRGAQGRAYKVAADYYLRFYPRWFTYLQALPVPPNTLVGPKRVTPLYKTVVAINDDTLYASAFVDVATEPAILTVPETTASYSLFTANLFGEIFTTTLPSATPGTYALTGPGWSGTLPIGVTQVEVPVDSSMWIIRADRYTDDVNTVEEAGAFRTSLRLQPLSKYLADPSGGSTKIVSELYYGVPYKGTADRESRRAPIFFLKQLQEAMHAPGTPPLSASEQRLSDRFDRLFGEGGANARRHRAQFMRAVRDMHALILRHYRSHTIGRNWIHFTNIGEWGKPNLKREHYLDRNAITEYIQWGNSRATAAYYHAFKDVDGGQLNGNRRGTYVLRFPKGQIPNAKRFWSLTAYLPGSIELVPNRARKYVVASYTPRLKTNRDGSISLYISHERPRRAAAANWLPAPRGKFNLMLRVYGPKGTVAKGTYVPPGIVKRG